jgi:chromosome segregation ATPase
MQPFDLSASDGDAEARLPEAAQISLEQSYFDRYNQQARDFERRQEQQLADLCTQLEDRQQENFRQQEENDKLQHQIAETQQANDKLQQQIAETQQANDKLQQQIAETQQALSDTHSKLEQIQAQLDELRQIQLRARHSYKTHFMLMFSETAHRLRRLKRRNH